MRTTDDIRRDLIEAKEAYAHVLSEPGSGEPDMAWARIEELQDELLNVHRHDNSSMAKELHGFSRPENSIDLDDISSEGGFIAPGTDGKWEITCINEGGFNCTTLPVKELIERLRHHFCLDCGAANPNCQCENDE